MDDILLYIAERGAERFEIVGAAGSEPAAIVFRYIDGRCTHDYWQNDVAMAMLCAEDEWGVPPSAWVLPAPGVRPPD